MPGIFNPNFNPAKVMMGNPTAPNAPAQGPYLPTKQKPTPPIANPIQGLPRGGNPQPQPIGGTPRRIVPGPSAPQPPSNILGPEAVRATGAGPYDNAYRQDLATYAGSQFQKPGGFLGLNPTGQLTGNPTGGGNAPVLGVPNDLLSMALGGQAFSFAPPQPTPAKSTNANSIGANDWRSWLQQMMGNRGI